MGTIDLAFLGTWVPVFLALGFFVWDKVDVRRREAAEARIIALLLSTELGVLLTRAEGLLETSDGHAADGLCDAFLSMDEGLRNDLSKHVDGLETGTLESVIARLHVLPAAAAISLMQLLSKVRDLRLAGSTLADMTNSEATKVLDEFMPHFRELVASVLSTARTAAKACADVANA